MPEITNYFRSKVSKISLSTQLAILITTTIFVIIISLVGYNYFRTIHTITEEQIRTTSVLLDLEYQNAEDYLEQINKYSLLMRNDESFLKILTTKHPLDYIQATYVKNLLRSNFYARDDVSSYKLYLLNSGVNYQISGLIRNSQQFSSEPVEDFSAYPEFTSKKYYRAIIPSGTPDFLMTYYRAIIDIQTGRPLAIVELQLDTSYMDNLAKSHTMSGEIFCLLDGQNRLFYTNNPLVTDTLIQEMATPLSASAAGNFTAEIDSKQYLAVFYGKDDTNWKVISFKPHSLIDQQVAVTRNVSLLLGLLALSVAVILVFLFIKLVTRPLTTLAQHLRSVGNGNFTATAEIGGSLEISNLTEDFNYMVHEIEQLIEKNYMAEFNEKTARLIALEAQLNPHFLYNTLQAISAEAIINHQPRLNQMIMALASMLRYSIKEEDMVLLKQEMKHVQDYLLLQEARFGSQLTYDLDISPETEQLQIPKISIQMLVENSIIHGMEESIHIKIMTALVGEELIISVLDNGCGIPPEKLEQLNALDKSSSLTAGNKANPSIGLANLSSRLQILYHHRASLAITSELKECTTVTLKIQLDEIERST